MDKLDKTKHIIPVCSESSLIDVEAFWGVQKMKVMGFVMPPETKWF